MAEAVVLHAVPGRPSARERLERILSGELVDAIEELLTELVADAVAAAGQTPPEAEWLTLDEAGRRLDMTADAVRMHANRGRLETRHVGRRRLVSRASVERLGGVR